MINQTKVVEAFGPKPTMPFKERADKVAFVKGDDNVEFAEVARAIDIMRGAGIEGLHVGLIQAKMQAGQ